MNTKTWKAPLLRWRWWAAGGLAVVVAAVAVVLLNSGDAAPTAAPGTSTESSSPSAPASATTTPSTSPAPSTPASSAPATPRATATAPATDANAGRPHAQAAKFTSTVAASKDVTVQIGKVEAIMSDAQLPGETSRPALRITVVARNTSNKAVPIKAAIVNAYYGPDRVPAASVLKPGSKWFPQSIPARSTAEGVFIFNIPVADRDHVDLEVDLDTDLKIVTFRGPVQPQA